MKAAQCELGSSSSSDCCCSQIDASMRRFATPVKDTIGVDERQQSLSCELLVQVSMYQRYRGRPATRNKDPTAPTTFTLYILRSSTLAIMVRQA